MEEVYEKPFQVCCVYMYAYMHIKGWGDHIIPEINNLNVFLFSDTDVFDQRLELPLRTSIRFGWGAELPEETTAGEFHYWSFSFSTKTGCRCKLQT